MALKFQEEARLSDARLTDDEDHLTEAGDDLVEAFRQRPELTVSTDEWGQPAFSLDVQTRPSRPWRNHLPRVHRLRLPLEREGPKGARMEIVADETVRRFGDDDASGIGGLLHPGRDVRRVAHRRVVHPQVAPDAADDDEAGVKSLPHPEADTAAPLQFVPVALEGPLNAERGMHRALRMIFVSDGRPEERHDAVAEELVDRALVAMDLGQHQLEGASHEPVDVLRIQSLGHRGEARHVDKEHRDLFALAFEGALRGQDPWACKTPERRSAPAWQTHRLLEYRTCCRTGTRPASRCRTRHR